MKNSVNRLVGIALTAIGQTMIEHGIDAITASAPPHRFSRLFHMKTLGVSEDEQLSVEALGIDLSKISYVDPSEPHCVTEREQTVCYFAMASIAIQHDTVLNELTADHWSEIIEEMIKQGLAKERANFVLSAFMPSSEEDDDDGEEHSEDDDEWNIIIEEVIKQNPTDI